MLYTCIAIVLTKPQAARHRFLPLSYTVLIRTNAPRFLSLEDTTSMAVFVGCVISPLLKLLLDDASTLDVFWRASCIGRNTQSLVSHCIDSRTQRWDQNTSAKRQIGGHAYSAHHRMLTQSDIFTKPDMISVTMNIIL
jgi:hypothetical protein